MNAWIAYGLCALITMGHIAFEMKTKPQSYSMYSTDDKAIAILFLGIGWPFLLLSVLLGTLVRLFK